MLKKVKINEKLYNEIIEYCKYNNIQDFEKEINKYLLTGFNIEKYNTSPFISKLHMTEEKTIEEKEIIVENNKENINITPEEKKLKKKKVRIIKN